MIKFKNRVEKHVPYNWNYYIDFIESEPLQKTKVPWYGASFMLNNEDNQAQFLEVYEPMFRDILTESVDRRTWLINHTLHPEFRWFPNNEDNLQGLRAIFKQYRISNYFRGSILISTSELLKIIQDVMLYPVSVFSEKGSLYADIDISNCDIPLIIKFTHHLTLDVLSTDKKIVDRLVDKFYSHAVNIYIYGDDFIKGEEFIKPRSL